MIGALIITDEDRAIQAYSKIAEQIAKEDERVDDRVTWGVSINGALLALLGVGGELFKDTLPNISAYVIVLVCVLAAFLSVIALLVCRWTIGAIQDARRQIYYVRKIYDDKWKAKIEDELGLPRPFGSRELYDKTIRISRWWGDDLFRCIGVIWILIIAACIGAAAYSVLRGLPGIGCGGIGF